MWSRFLQAFSHWSTKSTENKVILTVSVNIYANTGLELNTKAINTTATAAATTSTTILILSHYTAQPMLAGIPSLEVRNSVGVKFYCFHALPGSKQCIRIMQKTRVLFNDVNYTVAIPYKQD